MITLDRLDPDWKFAQNHGKANKAGYDITSPVHGSIVALPTGNIICKCCFRPIQKQKIPLGEHSKQLEVLGFGFPLFYEFLKNCILLLFLFIASYNIMSLRQAIENNFNFCHQNSNVSHRFLAVLQCYTVFVQMSRIQQNVTSEEEVLRIVSFIVHMIGLIYVRNKIIKLNKYYNERTPTFGNFSVIIKGLTKMKGIQKKVKQFFRSSFSQVLQVLHITLLPEYPEIDKLQKQRQQITNKLRPFYDKGQQAIDSQEARQLKQQLSTTEKKIHDVAIQSHQVFLKDEIECQKIICIFNNHRQKQCILKQYPLISNQIKQQYFGKQYKKVYILQAPQPTQIHWKDVNLPKKNRLCKILLSDLLSILTLAAIFIIIFFILQQKSLHLAHAIYELEHNQNNQVLLNEYQGAIVLTYIAMFLIVIFNKTILAILFHKFTQLERHTTTSKFQFSFQLKLSIGFFFTTALMTLAVQAIRFQNYYTHLYGVIDEESIMFFINSFFIPLFWLVNPVRIIKNVKRKINYGKRSLTQREANILMEDDPYDMGKKFAQVIQTMWFTFLYSSLLPVGAIITIFGLIAYYWVDKYNLLRRSSINRQISGKLIQTSLNLLDLTLFFKPIGSVIFDKHLRDECLASTIVMIVIGFIYAITPKNKIIEFFDNEKFRQHSLTYKGLDKYPIFTQTYYTQHPVIKIIHNEKIKKGILEKGLMTSQISISDNVVDMIDNSPSNILTSSKSINIGKQIDYLKPDTRKQRLCRNISTQALHKQYFQS